MAAATSERVLVTPEAVALDLPIADVGTRLASGLLDYFITVVGYILFTLATVGVGSWIGFGGGWAAVMFLLGVLVSLFVAPMLMETFWHGQTLGKKIVGLRVTTVEGTPIRFRHAFLRGTIRWVEAGPISVVSMLLTPRHQRVGDLLSGTVVVRYRSGMGMPVPLTYAVPEHASAFLSRLDTSVLSRDDLFAIRLLLERTSRLRREAAHQLTYDLATRVAHKMHVAPAADMGPRDFLISVAAAHRQHARRPTRRVGGGLLSPSISAGPNLADVALAPNDGAPTAGSFSDTFAAPS